MFIRPVNLLLLGVAAIFSVLTSPAQSVVTCPQFEFEGNQALWMLNGAPNQISIKARNGNFTPARYEWTFSRGKIVDGQGSKTISLLVETSDDYSAVTASVTISGLPDKCIPVWKAEIAVSPVGCELPIDSYGNVSKKEEMVRLDNFFIRLGQDAANEGFFVIGFEAKASRSYKIGRLRRVLDMVRRRQFDLTKLTFAVYERPEDLPELTIFQIGNENAVPSIESKNFSLVKGERLENEFIRLFPKRYK